ncbi:hypothetical protein [Nocardioides sp. SLBN-35]|jgi:hypothetical protein|uniref:hypothetical protein n=1 Tax=Nocardioides sp. SLBN-35 TaxID=2768445 RepID=UPI001151FF58|nr:hypothetical protein [Nocardioides sp. SLBN-35]TQK71366.1 hypothetical protein FBY23_3157 [Nocardioides sp. SLBN-35]
MSKMDAVRAMREARYAEAQARAGRPAPTPRAAKPAPAAPAKAAPVKAAKAAKDMKAAAAPAAETDDSALCGHRNISGRTCTRERGHAAKSHRYS